VAEAASSPVEAEGALWTALLQWIGAACEGAGRTDAVAASTEKMDLLPCLRMVLCLMVLLVRRSVVGSVGAGVTEGTIHGEGLEEATVEGDVADLFNACVCVRLYDLKRDCRELCICHFAVCWCVLSWLFIAIHTSCCDLSHTAYSDCIHIIHIMLYSAGMN
jgi:hypothetical protein